jgi:hypothetical protein
MSIDKPWNKYMLMGVEYAARLKRLLSLRNQLYYAALLDDQSSAGIQCVGRKYSEWVSYP